MTSLIFASSVALLSVTDYSFPSSIYLCPRQRDPEGYHCSIPMSPTVNILCRPILCQLKVQQ